MQFSREELTIELWERRQFSSQVGTFHFKIAVITSSQLVIATCLATMEGIVNTQAKIPVDAAGMKLRSLTLMDSSWIMVRPQYLCDA